MEYLPFGETLVEEHLNSYNSPFKFNAKELEAETGNYYYGARYYDPKWSIWISVDPLAEKYSGWSPYHYTYNNPINFIDPDGREIDPVDNKSGRRVQREIRNTFREQGYNNVAKLFKYNKKTGTFNNVSQDDFDAAIAKDVTNNSNLLQSQKDDVTALAQGYFDAANSSEVHSVEAVRRGENLTSSLSTVFGDVTGKDVENSGGGFNYGTSSGSHTVYLVNPKSKLDFVNNSTGNVFQRKVSSGDLLAHELLGHGLTRYNSGGSQYQNAIQLSNLYLRVVNRGPKIWDSGAHHGGNPRGHGVPMPAHEAWGIPSYLKPKSKP